jgi:hypothetical protein
VVGAAVRTAVNLGFLDRSRYFFIQVAPQLSSRGLVDPVTDPLQNKQTPWPLVRTRTIPTDRPPLVDEI